jgi:PAS domain S-box-containing protein
MGNNPMVRLILAEDEFIIATDIQSRLRGTGYDVVGIAATGEDAIAQAGELRPDVVLMDIVLKGEMDGIDAAQQITERFDIPVIFLSAHTDAGTVKRAAATASYGFLVKPFDELELRAAIEMAIYKHKMEAKARESERRIRELTESLSEVIFETDMAGTITFINRAGLNEFGYTTEQVEGGMTLYDFIPPDKHEEIRETIAHAVIDEPSEWIGLPGLRRDGSTFPVSVRASLIVREGVPVGMRGIALNVTEQKRAEQKLEESERRIRELTDSLPDIVFETDVGGTFTFLNHTGMTSLGYTEDDLKNPLTLEDVIIPADHVRARENFRKRLDGIAWEWVEYTVLRKDGSTFPASIRSTAIMRDGAVDGLRGITVDITERKRAEQKLRESEQRIRELTDTLPVVVYETDETGRFAFVNATAFDLFGYTKEEIEAGMSIFQMITDPDQERARAVFHRRVGGEDVGRIEYTGLRKDGGMFPILVRAVQMRRDGAVIGIRGVIVDFTEQKQAEEMVKEHTHTIEILNRIMTAGTRAASVESFAETVTTLTLELMHFDAGTIYLVDEDARCAKLRYATGISDSAVQAIREIRLDETPYAVYLIEKGPLFVDGQEASRVPHVVELGLKSLAVVPLYRYDEIIGALTVGSFKRHTFSQAEKELLTTIGNEVGTVIAELQADDALKESEQRFRALFESSPIVQIRYDVDGHPVYVNRAALEFLGIADVADIQHISIFSSPRVSEANKAQLRAGHTVRYEQRYDFDEIKKHGDFPTTQIGIRFVDFHIAPLFSAGMGKVEGYIGQVADITERKRAEQKLRESEQRIRELTDTLPVVVYETDETGRFAFVNATAFDLFGYTKEEIEAGMSIFQMITDPDQERARAVFHRRVGGEDVGRIEYTGLRKDGSTFPIVIRAVLMRRDGAVIGVRGVILDVTERKRAEEKVKERTHTIETLNRIMTEGNKATDVQSFAKTVTDLALELLHFDVGTIHLIDYDARCANLCYVTGLPDIAVEAIKCIPLDKALYARVLVEGRLLFVDGHEASRVPHAAELGLKSLAVVPLYRYDKRIGVLTVGSFKRHTSSQAEQELLIAIGNEAGVVIAKLQADELIRTTLKERETLLKEIHHRVKNNMQVISSLLSLQAAQATEPETIDMFSESQRRIRSMALIHEKLYRSGSLAEIDFGDYVESLVGELLRMYNVPLGAITTTVEIENVQLGVDAAIPCALIINELVSNSLKYAFPDGRTGGVTVALKRENEAYTLTVADDGVGFPPDVDFRATDSLGMQLVVTLVNQLEGTIELNRENGTAFVISFHVD